MDTLKISMSKANSVRFAHVDGNMASFDNTLSFNETWFNKSPVIFDQTFFVDDVVLIQVKSGLTATITFLQILDSGITNTISATTTTTYTDFKIHEYPITHSAAARFYYKITSEESEWRSECVSVIAEDTDYLLLQWTNLDDVSDSFEFDYSTVLAIANVNYMRIRGQLLTYKPAGETTVYDNQNEKAKIKGSVFRMLTMDTEQVPRQIAEKIIIATQHDSFLVNEVGYISEELPEVNPLGAGVVLSANLTLAAGLGINANDIGFTATTDMIENKVDSSASGAETFAVTSGFGVSQIIVKKLTGTPSLKIGSTVGGTEIFPLEVITNTVPPLIENVRYTPDITGAWTIYYDCSGGTVYLHVQTTKFIA